MVTPSSLSGFSMARFAASGGEVPRRRSFYDMLEMIEQRPGMYFRGPALEAIKNFLFGYEMAERVLPYDWRKVWTEDPPFEGFGAFIQARLGPGARPDPDPMMMACTVNGVTGERVDLGFRAIDYDRILEVAGSQAAAQTLFFKLLGEYRSGASCGTVSRPGQ